MNFEELAYLFDSSILGDREGESVGVVQSYIGNPLYLQTYAREALDKFDYISLEDIDINDWLKKQDNIESLVDFLLNLYEDFGKLNVTSFFIEKDYTLFIYLIGLLIPSSEISDPSFRINIDNLYIAYKNYYNDGIKRDTIVDTITVFNERVESLICSDIEHVKFKTLLQEKKRSIGDQLLLFQKIASEADGFIITDYFFYVKQLHDIYHNKGIKNIYATEDVANRFMEATKRFHKSSDGIVNIKKTFYDKDELVYKFARFIMMLSSFYIEKIFDIKDVKTVDEEEKYLYVILWLLFQSGDSYMFINNNTYEVMKDVFMSLKKEIIM